MRTVFFGSSSFSLNALKACHDSPLIDLVAVITIPPSKKGRGLKESPTVIADWAREQGINVFEFPSLKPDEVFEVVKELNMDLMVLSSYGKLIPDRFLELPKNRLNVHPSLLPQYRGASPLNGPILNGDKVTGLTICDICSALDAGEIYYQKTTSIGSETTSESLGIELSKLSYDALLELFEKIDQGKLTAVQQKEEDSSYAHKLNKDQGLVALTERAYDIDLKIRGLQPWPGAYFFLEGLRIQIVEGILGEETDLLDKPGTLLEIQKSGAVRVATGEGDLVLRRVKAEGKKEMAAADFLRGRRMKLGMVLTSP